MNRIGFCFALLLCIVAGPAFAASQGYEITVAAGEVDRANYPVCVPLAVPAALGQAQSVVVLDSSGKPLPSQLTGPALLAKAPAGGAGPKELHFILPSLKAGQTATFKATVSSDPPGKSDGFGWFDNKGEYTELKFGTRPVLRYMYAYDDSTRDKREVTYKVYHHLYDPDGQFYVTKGPGGLYPHHRGLYYGFNKITYDGKQADIWHCNKNEHQTHGKFLGSEAGPVLGRHRMEILWYGQSNDVFAREERELTVFNVPGGQMVGFASRLHSTGSKIKLDGDPQHAGFQFRASQEVAEKNAKQTYYIRPDGIGKPNETKQGGDFPWKGMSFILGEQRYTTVYLDKPSNPKPAQYSEREYGRFGSYFVAEVTPEKPLEVNYRVWLQKGELKVDDLAAMSANFVKPVEVKVK